MVRITSSSSLRDDNYSRKYPIYRLIFVALLS